jgi:hypothetical protein
MMMSMILDRRFASRDPIETTTQPSGDRAQPSSDHPFRSCVYVEDELSYFAGSVANAWCKCSGLGCTCTAGQERYQIARRILMT